MVAVRPATVEDAEAVGILRSFLDDATPFFKIDPLCDFVAQVEGEVVGWIQVTFHEDLPEIGARGAWIQSVAVLPRSRGQGIGQELLRTAESQAIQAGDRTIACQPLNEDSAHFFERLGFADNTPPDHEPFWSKPLA